MFIFYISVTLCLCLLYWWKHYASKPHHNFPDGPIGIPILGYVPILQAKRQSIYVFATISLANHYHNISGKSFILTDHCKKFSSNVLQKNLLLSLCVLSQNTTVIITTVLFWDNTHNFTRESLASHY